MAVFSYRGTNGEGAVLEGAIEAPDEQAAAEQLKNAHIIPIAIALPGKSLKTRLGRRTTAGDLLNFTTELSALLEAGLPIDRSLNILSGLAEKKEKQILLQTILRSIREGSSFSDALQKHPRVFSRLYINMVRAGEAGGVLPTVLEKLTEFLETTQELKEQVLSSMIYPIILLSTGGISILILLTYVLPKFSTIFAELGGAMPLSTQLLLSFSRGLQSYWWVVLPVFFASWILFRTYIKSDTGRYRWDGLKLKLMKEILQKLETARFCRTLGTLLRSGVPLLQALKNSRDVIGNQVIALALEEVSKGVKEGKGMALPLSGTGVFPPLALSMIKVGEETGQLDVMLLKVAAAYEKSLRVSIKRFISFLEPALILGMGLIIGFIVMSMLLAVFSITDLPF
ncbi:MAG: type II secretion system F family protein [Thermodesulfobacteriota bacterium]